MLRGLLMIRGAPDYQRAHDSWEGPWESEYPDIKKGHWWWLWLSLGPLIVTGVLFFFLPTRMVRGAPTALTGFSVGFRTHFVTSVRVSVASAGVLTLTGLRPTGARNPQKGVHTLSAPWLRPCPLGYVPAGRVCKLKFCKLTTWPYSWQALRGSVSCGRGLHKISLVISALRGRRESGKNVRKLV